MNAVNVDDVLKILHKYGKYIFVTDEKKYSDMVDEIANLKALEQEPSRDMEEINEVINCDADAETKCKMISDILTAKPHYFEEPFINKPCISSGVCEHDKNKVLNKIRAEIAEYGSIMVSYAITKDTKTDKGIEKLVSDVLKEAKEQVLDIIDKYRAESEDNND